MCAERVVRGPLGPYAAGFLQWLAAQGYLPGPARNQFGLVVHLSRWLEEAGLEVGGLTEERAAEYVAVRRAEHRVLHSVRALRPLLCYLGGLGILAAAPVGPPDCPDGELLAAFGRYLRQERGLAELTAGRYEYWARAFVATRADAGAIAEVCAADVHHFVLKATRELSVPAAKQLVSALRALLRFLQVSGITDRDLLGAVPGVAGWSMAHLPRGLDRDEVRRLLGSPDRSTAVGMRDYAVLLVLCRLGLRAGEVARLRLDDVDWCRGELLVAGKGSRLERLPLPHDVGAALATYLHRGRPRDEARRALFLRVRAPRGGLNRGGVGAIVARAGRAAGIEAAGAHRLRHSVATELLGAGASLTEVGQVLRHASISSTAIYAKVDRLRLGELARPWPGRQP